MHRYDIKIANAPKGRHFYSSISASQAKAIVSEVFENIYQTAIRGCVLQQRIHLLLCDFHNCTRQNFATYDKEACRSKKILQYGKYSAFRASN